MVKVLLTGMSGVGKSTVLKHLSKEGHLTVDLDYGDWIIYNDEIDDYVMDSQKIITYLKRNSDKTIFIAGTTINQTEIYPYVDVVITLTAPLEVMKERIQARDDNPFGKSEEDWAKVVEDTRLFEPRLIQSSDVVISTDKPINEVIKEIFESTGL